MRVVALAVPNNRDAKRREADKAKLARDEQRRREDALARQRLAERRERRRQEEVKAEEARKVCFLLSLPFRARIEFQTSSSHVLNPTWSPSGWVTRRCPHNLSGPSYSSRGLDHRAAAASGSWSRAMRVGLLKLSPADGQARQCSGSKSARRHQPANQGSQHADHFVQARRAERSREREERVKNLGGVLRKESTPGLPLAVALASGMAVAEQVCTSQGIG